MLAMAVGLLLCARLDEAGAVAVAAVLLHKGFNPVVAVAMLSIGPFTRRPLMRAMREKNRFLWLGVVAVVWLFAWKGGLVARAAPVARAVLAGLRDPVSAQAASSPLGAASAAVLIALALATLWTAGVRGWFAPLRHGPRTA